MANTYAIRQQAVHTTYQLSPPICSIRTMQKRLSLNKKCLRIFEKSQEKGPLAENDKTERARGLGRKTIQETGKRNQMTALRCQTGGEAENWTSPPPFGGYCTRILDTMFPSEPFQLYLLGK